MLEKENTIFALQEVRGTQRQRAEKRFKLMTQLAVAFALGLLALLLLSLLARGLDGFRRAEIQVEVAFDPALLAVQPEEKLETLPVSRFLPLAAQALKTRFPEVQDAAEQRQLLRLLSLGSGRELKTYLLAHPEAMGRTVSLWLPAASAADQKLKAKTVQDDATPAWLERLRQDGRTRLTFNRAFLTRGDSRLPEQAGFLAGIMGSLWTMLTCLSVALPLGVATAVYLEEFAPRRSKWGSRLIDLIEININNLAAVPSIVFGLLGLAVYINFLHLPRSAPLVGGLTLALMVLPVMIIASRTAIRSVPQSMRDAALALGASPLQTVWHHVLPLSLPGIMTGTILSVARALGETAPLLLIGMVAFVADVPHSPLDAATAMPVQIYLWASSPEAGFSEKTSAGILVLLALLIGLNALAITLRKKFEIRW